MTLATVTTKVPGGATRGSGKGPGDASALTMDPQMEMNGTQQRVVQNVGAETVVPSVALVTSPPPTPGAWGALLGDASVSGLAASPSQLQDAYWQLLHEQAADRLAVPTDWVAYELALAMTKPMT